MIGSKPINIRYWEERPSRHKHNRNSNDTVSCARKVISLLIIYTFVRLPLLPEIYHLLISSAMLVALPQVAYPRSTSLSLQMNDYLASERRSSNSGIWKWYRYSSNAANLLPLNTNQRRRYTWTCTTLLRLRPGNPRYIPAHNALFKAVRMPGGLICTRNQRSTA